MGLLDVPSLDLVESHDCSLLPGTQLGFLVVPPSELGHGEFQWEEQTILAPSEVMQG